MGRHQALPPSWQQPTLSSLRRTLGSLKGRTLSPTAQLLVLVGTIAGAVVLTIMVAAIFISTGSEPARSRNVAVVGTPTPSRSPSPSTTPSPTPSKTETITPVATPTIKPTITNRQERPTVAFYSTDRWNGGFVGVVTIINNTGESLRWELTFQLRGDIQQSWQAQIQSDGDTVVARGLSYNAVIAPGQRAQFGFRAEGTSRARLRDCMLNGESCQLSRG